jgi:tRNA A-37 threonylcarbamoyl transferase component Bud32
MTGSFGQAPVRAGQVLFGRYVIESVLGSGGMGVVVAATDTRLDQRVALKFLLPQALEHPDVVERFAREARAAVRIQSEHVARVIDVGALEDGAPFMVMEHLEGRDLASLIRARGQLPVEEAVDFILQACEAVAEAHRLGIVHRDMKPANLFLVEGRGVSSGVVKVLDFGISKTFGLAASSPAAMTQSVAILGSPLYMSPEQMNSARDVDGRTDIWALGVTLYELLAGSLPFAGSSLPELCMAITNREPAPLRAARPEVPSGLEAVVQRCLEKDRARRFPGMKELVIALRPFAPPRSQRSVERVLALSSLAEGSGTLSAPPSGSAPAAGPELGATSTAPGWGKTGGPRFGPGKRTLVLTGLVAGAVVSAVVVGLAVRHGSPSNAAASASAPFVPPSLDAIPATSRPEPLAMPAAAPSESAASAPTTAEEPAPSPGVSLLHAPAASARHPQGPPHPPPPKGAPSARPKADGWEDER